jgi:hypothetical protein
MRRLFASCVCAGFAALGTGCAALSLFGQNHEHVHHHGCDCEDASLVKRLDAIERQLSRLQPSGGEVILPASAAE